IPPFFMAGTRFLTSGLLLYFSMRWWGASRPRLEHWKSSLVVAFFLILVANGGVCWVEQKVPSGITALMVGTVPLWIVLLEWLWKGGARPKGKIWMGILLGMSGIVVLTFFQNGTNVLQVDPWGALFLVGTSLAWAIGSLYARSAPLPSSALLATGMEMIVGGFMQLIVGLILGERNHFHLSDITAHSAEAWVYLTLIGSLVGFTSYIWVLQKATPELASTYAFVNPVIAIYLGWLLAGESVTPPVFLATALIIAAVVLITLGKRGSYSTPSKTKSA
ncbi:MAG TPA: EamA family transporter, partial [bacterium]